MGPGSVPIRHEMRLICAADGLRAGWRLRGTEPRLLGLSVVLLATEQPRCPLYLPSTCPCWLPLGTGLWTVVCSEKCSSWHQMNICALAALRVPPAPHVCQRQGMVVARAKSPVCNRPAAEQPLGPGGWSCAGGRLPVLWQMVLSFASSSLCLSISEPLR